MLTKQTPIGRNGHAKLAAPASSNGPAAPTPVGGYHDGVAAPRPVVGFHGAVGEFKRRLIEATLAQAGGNRTRAAKALGLQRTYLLRLMREFQIRFPLSPVPPRRMDADDRPSPRDTP